MGPYYVDFYCPAAKLVIEIDGPSHSDEWAAYDIRRQAWLEAEGYKVIRFSVYDIDEEVVDVMDSISYELEERAKLGFRQRRSEVRPSPSVGSADTSP
jgi:very-short-patch-repair endonuclease